MSETQTGFSTNRLSIGLILAFIIFAGAFPLATSSGGGTSPNTCTSANVLCGPIRFITSAVGNSTATFTSTISSMPITVNQNDSMVVVPYVGSTNFIPAGVSMVTSLTDSLNTGFSHIITENFLPGSADNYSLEVWFGKATVSGSDTLTAVWNNTNSDKHIMVADYAGVSNVGNFTGIRNGLSLSLTTTASGSWIFGTTIGSAPCSTFIESTNFILRNRVCNSLYGSDGIIGDNATALRNNLALTYTVTTGGGSVFAGPADALIELVPSDLEPNQPLNLCIQNSPACGFCPATGPTCVVNFANKATGITNSNQLLHSGTTYCTGVTTSAMSTFTGPTNVLIIFSYSGESRNVTGLFVTVIAYISTTAPTTTFGAGACGGSPEDSVTLYCPVTSSTGTAIFTITGSLGFNTVSFGASTTFYASISITPKANVAFDNLGGSSTISTPGSSIEIIQE